MTGLNKSAGRPNEEVNEVYSSFVSVEGILTILSEEIPLIDLVVVKLPAEPNAVGANNLGEDILNLIGVVTLSNNIGRNAEREIVKNYVGNAFQIVGNGPDAAVERTTRL